MTEQRQRFNAADQPSHNRRDQRNRQMVVAFAQRPCSSPRAFERSRQFLHRIGGQRLAQVDPLGHEGRTGADGRQCSKGS